MPPGTANGTATITVTTANGSFTQTISVGNSAPGLFTANLTGLGPLSAQVVSVAPGGAQTYNNTAMLGGTAYGGADYSHRRHTDSVSRCRELRRWSAFQEFFEYLKPVLQSLPCRHRGQADAHGGRDVVAIDRKSRRRRDPDPTLAAVLGEVLGAPCLRKSDPPMGRGMRGGRGLRQNAFGKLVA
jgi:hypothetical protein